MQLEVKLFVVVRYLQQLPGNSRSINRFNVIYNGRVLWGPHIRNVLTKFLEGECNGWIVDGIFADDVCDLGVLFVRVF